MKTKEEIFNEQLVFNKWLKELTESEKDHILSMMESYASQQTEKYKELILEQDKLIKLQESSQYFEVIEAKEVRREIIQKLKTELGL